MNAPSALLNELSEEAVWRLEEICCRFEQCWQAGQRPCSEDFLAGAAGAERMAVLRELLRLDLYYRRRTGEEPSAQDYATRFPDAAAVLRELFPGFPEGGAASFPVPGPEDTSPDAERTGPHLGAVSSGQGNVAATEESRSGPCPNASASSPPASRFRVLRFHAAGGLGEVFVAEDVELHREVALKEIKRAHIGSAESQARFVLEAEITGNLEHPGIVPVYGLGTYPDGRPFYAMRFIHGDTLAAAIERFHSQPPVRFDSLEFRQLLGRLVAVCQAIAYAHNRGVLHRDLKPGNIMLGKFGETLVVDWGLAKVVGRPEASTASPGEEELLSPIGGRRAQVTVGLAGTPAFMSPEQAAGKVEELGQATDIYSLGATLYVLLTNRAPFDGPVVEVVQQVQRGAWLAPRQVNGSVPAVLDAICRKAMALRPQERYGSALALAEDVEHWLADEPVQAYAESAAARLRRWLRKHPRGVTAAVVLLLALVIGLTAGTIFQEQRKREAEENFRITRETTRKFLVAVNEEDLLNEPGMQPLRMKLLMEALDYYKAFLEKRPGDPEVRQERANANRQLGELYGEKDRMAEAIPLVQQSLKEYLELREKAPRDAGLQRGLAQAYLALADLRVRSGEPTQGREDVNQAIPLLESLTTERPGDPELLTLLGRAYDVRATAQSQVGLLEEALADNAKAGKLLWRALFVVLQEDHGRLRPGYFRHEGTTEDLRGQFAATFLVFRAWLNQGMLQKRAGQDGAAVQSFAIAARAARRLQNAYPFLGIYHPRLARLRIGLAVALLNAGYLEAEMGRPGAGRADLLEALELARGFLQAPSAPVSAEYKAIFAQAAGSVGEDLFRSGQTSRAAELLREAEVVAKEVSDGNRKSQTLRGQRGHILSVLGRLEGERGNLDSGLRYCEQAWKEQERAIQETPWDRVLCSDGLDTRETIARLRFLTGQTGRDAWIREQWQILAERRDLARRGPSVPRFQRQVGASAAVLAGLLLETGQAREAVVVVEEVLPPHERLVRDDRLVARLRARNKDLPKKDDYHSGPRGLVSHLDKIIQDLPDNFSDRHPLHEPVDYQLRRVWAELLAKKGAALTRLGQDAAAECVCQAIALAEELIQGDGYFACPPCSWESLWPFLALQASRREPCYLYDLACHLALASTLPGQGGQPDPAARAVQALQQYVAAGFDNLHQLRTDPRLLPLRQRDDFQKLVLNVEAKVRAREGRLPNH